MRWDLSSARLVLAALAILAAGGVGNGQDAFVYHVTGDVVVSLAGVERTFSVYAVDIPANVAEGITDPAVRAILEAAAGTREHGATWDVPEPVTMGTIVLSRPTSMAITVAARPTEDPRAGLGELRLRFELDLTTLALVRDKEIAVWYFPAAFSIRDFYALTEGELEVTLVDQVDDRTLHVQGSFTGVLTFQPTVIGGVTHNPSDTIAVNGRFDLRSVVGTRDLADVR